MKKLIMLVLAIIFLCGAITQDINWYDYVGKRVLIVTIDNTIYQGEVTGIVKTDICLDKDSQGNCIHSKIYYTMLLIDDHINSTVLRCEAIRRIAEIE